MANEMNREQFLKTMELLWDNQGKFKIHIHGSSSIRSTGSKKLKEDTLAHANTLKKMIRTREYPFDIDVVAVKDILALDNFKGLSPTRLGLALNYLGCRKYGQIMDDSEANTRVWIVREYEKYIGVSKKRISTIFQQRIR